MTAVPCPPQPAAWVGVTGGGSGGGAVGGELLASCRMLPLQARCGLGGAWAADRLRWHLDAVHAVLAAGRRAAAASAAAAARRKVHGCVGLRARASRFALLGRAPRRGLDRRSGLLQIHTRQSERGDNEKIESERHMMLLQRHGRGSSVFVCACACARSCLVCVCGR